MLAQIQLQRPSKQFQQHFKADLRNRRVIPAFAELITDKCVWNRRIQLATRILLVRVVGPYVVPKPPHKS
jgi:hypothetical protein